MASFDGTVGAGWVGFLFKEPRIDEKFDAIIILALKSVYDLLKLISAITKILKHVKAGSSRTH